MAAAALAEPALQASIQESLALFQYDNAKFLGERLVALNNSEHNQQLLATCYIHCNQAYRAYHLLKGHNSDRSRYLLAVCCVNMVRYSEAKEALLKGGDTQIPFGYAGLYLLGKVCRLTNSMSEAKDYYLRALRLNPLMWSAYEELCAVGGDEEAAEVCSLAQAPARPAADGPSPSTSSQISSAMTHHHQRHPTQQQQPQQPQQQHGNGQGGHAGPGKEPHRTPAQQHHPAGPAGTSGTGPAPRSGGFGFTGFGAASAAPSAGPQGFPAFGGFASGGGGGGGGGGPLFQTPVQGQGGLFASPMPTFGAGAGSGGGFGTGFGFGVLPTGAVPASAQPVDSTIAAQPSGSDGGAGPPSTAGNMFGFAAAGAFGGGGGGGGGGMFATPTPSGMGPQPPAPPQKQQLAFGHSEVPFPGFSAGARGSGAGGSGAAGGPSGQRGGSGSGPGGHHRISRMMDEGKVRKVSNKLFSDPRSSVRRSQRLAALNSASAASHAQGQTAVTPSAAAGAAGPGQQGAGQGYSSLFGGGASGSVSALGQAKSGQASYVEGDSQNVPDPRDPPRAPVQQQLHPDAKLTAAAATPQQLFAAFGGRAGAALPQGAAADAHAGNPLHAHPPGGAGGPSTESRTALLALLGPFMEGCRHLAAYRCADAVSALGRLPVQQLRTAWVQCALGRAHFESMSYQRAAQSYELARQLDRTRLEGMELYSTVLWHTKREYELSHLAQECVATDRLAPQTWCVMGNLFSGQKEHEAAIEFFLRAAQVDPTFTYAYTLAGHEYFANEDYDKAAACYRSALKLDPRHYNAMYGLGMVSYKQEKYGEALQSFRLAAGVNPRSSVLRCYAGMSAAKLGQHAVALDKLKEAIELDPANPLARYERATVLASLDQVEEALAELESLQRVAPGEASVAFQMGKLYKRLNNLTAAQQSFELALSYSGGSTSDAATIKGAIERLGLSDDDEEEEV